MRTSWMRPSTVIMDICYSRRSNPRGVFEGTYPTFDLELVWRGSVICGRMSGRLPVFGHLGSLGFRSRRAMGALAFHGTAPELMGALKHFAKSDGVNISERASRELQRCNREAGKMAERLACFRTLDRPPNGPAT